MTGRVFDIRRFSTHDGSGLRTNIFFKGCPLRCVWCQNPEGLDPVPAPAYFANRCIGCGTCLKHSSHTGVRECEGKIRLDKAAPEDWDAICDACPTGALAMDAREYSVEELADEAEKDRVFYRDDGGVTLSGGEPLMQGEFAAQLLEELQRRGLHTAIETSLQAPEETVRRVLPFLDQIFADMKIFNAEDHKRHTGASNERIKANFELILRSEHRGKVTARTPLIPGYTAMEENLASIARFLSGLDPEIRYELLNYNPLAEAKYRSTDRTYCFAENPRPYSAEQMRDFGRIVRKNGIRNLILDI